MKFQWPDDEACWCQSFRPKMCEVLVNVVTACEERKNYRTI